jgi:phosphatidylcholine synthase
MKQPTIVEKSLAWTVHIFTASGLLAGFMAILSIQAKDWKATMFWLFLSLVIDGIDGTFARQFKVKEVLPDMDGRIMDYVIDFATYAIIPAYFFYEADLVPVEWELGLTFIILLVSALYYGKTGMVSDDKYFIGFPVLWNLVIFYMVFVVDFSPLINAFFIVFFAILHFVPIKFAYPSQASRLKGLTRLVSLIFLLAMPTVVYLYPVCPFWLKAIMMLTILYFGGIAIWDTFRKN